MLELERLNATLPVLVQGVSGRMGRLHTRLMRAYGTNIVAGTSSRPDSAESEVPVFRDCKEAVAATGAVASIAMTPALETRAAVEEAVASGVRLIVTVAEGIPVHDSLRIRALTLDAGVTWIGPSTPGLAVPGQMKIGFLPNVSLAPGNVGVMSKSGTLSYEVCRRLVLRGIGQSVWIGVGGDPVKGLRFGDLAQLFARHDPTTSILLIGEIGGAEEEEFAQRWAALGSPKPVYALIAGAQAKEGVAMGHAGAMLLGHRGSLASKRSALEGVGARVFSTMKDLVESMSGNPVTGRRDESVARESNP